jgi:glycosyltransferase involved in cell wall biosynthesis
LVLTGRADGETPAVAERARALGVAERVHQLGRVPESELDALYRSATAMVFPSVYEGFGLPLLEAMARGCPVIATDAAAIPEVVGDAGLVVAPASPDALARAIERVLTEDGLRADLAARGRSRSAEFGWRAAGLSLLDAYRGALASRAPS